MCGITSPVFIINQKNANFHGLIDETEYVDARAGTKRGLLQRCDGGLGCSAREAQTSDCRRNRRVMPVTNIQALQLCAKKQKKKIYKLQRWWEVWGEEVIIPHQTGTANAFYFHVILHVSNAEDRWRGALTTAFQSGCAERGFRAKQLYVRLDLDGTNRCKNGRASLTMGQVRATSSSNEFSILASVSTFCVNVLFALMAVRIYSIKLAFALMHV